MGGNSLVDELGADPEGLGHVAQSERAVRLQQLAVGLDPHLTHVVTVVWREEPVLLHLLLHRGCHTKTQSVKVVDTPAGRGSVETRLTQGLEEDRVTALVQREEILAHRGQTVQHLQDLGPLDHL